MGKTGKQGHKKRYNSEQGTTIHSLNESSGGVSFGVSAGLRDAMEDALLNQNFEGVKKLLIDLRAQDISDLINHLKHRFREPLFHLLKEDLDPQILVGVTPSLQIELLNLLDIEQVVSVIKKLPSDDALGLLETMDEEWVHRILKRIPVSERSTFEQVLQYPDKSAGRLMQREVVCVPEHWCVAQVLTFIRDRPKSMVQLPRFFYDVFVVNPRHHPVGRVPVNQLLRHDSETLIQDIMMENVNAFPDVADQEDVAQAFKHYALVSAPIISSSGRIIGMVTVDDIVHVLEEEAEEDILYMNKVKGDSDFYAPIPTTAYWRTRWLLITLVNTLIASYVISQFQASIQQITALSFLMTINAAMGGNAGMQVVTVVVRALATRSLLEEDTWRAVRKELGVSLLAGGFCSLLLGVIAGFWVNSVTLGIILSVSLICNMLWASFAGTLLPIIVSRFNLDPAISAGPILTTTTDVFGYALFLGLATLFLM